MDKDLRAFRVRMLRSAAAGSLMYRSLARKVTYVKYFAGCEEENSKKCVTLLLPGRQQVRICKFVCIFTVV